MGYPKQMTDESLAANGFRIDPATPDVARNGNSMRYHCVDCGVWTNKSSGRAGERVCDRCFRKRFRSGR